jgi:hypothetical protein
VHEIGAQRSYLFVERDEVHYGCFEFDPINHEDQSLSARSSPYS